MSLQEWLNETLAVLVLYKKPLDSSTSFKTLTQSLKVNSATIDLLIYDNSPTSAGNSPQHQNWRITYSHDPLNPGVSKAYNEGAKKAAQMGKKWLLLLDQDTEFRVDTFDCYYKSLLAYPNQVCFVPKLIDSNGIISPFKFLLGNGIRVKSVSEGIHFFNNLQFVNSGLMISIKAFEQALGYDEDFPLDFSDYAFVERLRENILGFVLISLRAQHGLSSSEKTSMENTLIRFTHFTQAAKLFRKKYHATNRLITIRPFMRAIKLCFKFKTLKFLVSIYRA